MKQTFYKIRPGAERIGLSPRTLRRMVKDGRLPELRSSPGTGCLLFREEDLLRAIGLEPDEPEQPAPRRRGRPKLEGCA